MLAKKYRLTRNVDIMQVLKKGRFVKGSMVNLKWVSRDFQTEEHTSSSTKSRVSSQEENSRVAVIVSKKVFKRAVDRNRARRLARESVRHLFPQIKPGYDLVFLIQSPIFGKTQSEVEIEVRELLESANLLI